MYSDDYIFSEEIVLDGISIETYRVANMLTHTSIEGTGSIPDRKNQIQLYYNNAVNKFKLEKDGNITNFLLIK